MDKDLLKIYDTTETVQNKYIKDESNVTLFDIANIFKGK